MAAAVHHGLRCGECPRCWLFFWFSGMQAGRAGSNEQLGCLQGYRKDRGVAAAVGECCPCEPTHTRTHCSRRPAAAAPQLPLVRPPHALLPLAPLTVGRIYQRFTSLSEGRVENIIELEARLPPLAGAGVALVVEAAYEPVRGDGGRGGMLFAALCLV